MIPFSDFSRIQPGDAVRLRCSIDEKAVETFASLSGDRNPLHMDSEFARHTCFEKRVVHGMLVASFVSTLIGENWPGSLWTQQTFNWRAPVFIGDDIDFCLKVVHKSEAVRVLMIEVEAANQQGTVVMDGKGSLMILDKRNPEKGGSS